MKKNNDKVKCQHLILICLMFFFCGPVLAQQPAFPGAEGFGRYTTGGRGGEVYHVTNLNDDGAGSFRDAVSQSGRIVVFDVGGVINIEERIVIHSDITVAGQTAPGGCITIYGNGIAFNDDSGNDIIRYIRIRMGQNGDYGKDAVSISAGQDYIFDHVSISWGRDGTLDVNGSGIDNLTFQDCIISQGINNDNHSTGGLMQSGKWSMIRSLYIDNKTRNPKARGTHEFINSVLYNWASNGYIMGDTEGTSECNMIGNYFIYGPSSSDNTHFTRSTETFYVYGEDNWVDSDVDGILDGSLISDYKTATVMSSPFDYPGVNNLMSAQDALNHVIDNVGASLVRDEVDELLISQLLSYGTEGSIINIEEDNGITNNVGTVASGTNPTDTDQDGMPDSWEEDNGMDPNTADDTQDNDGDGYTNIEEYLECIIDNSESSVTDAFATIEAENFSYQFGVQAEACDEGGEDVGYINDGDWIGFSNLDFGDNGASEFIVRAASNSSEGTIHIRLDGYNSSYTEIGSIDITSTGGWQTYIDFSCDVSQISGVHDLYLVFEGGDGYLFNLNYFSFTEGSSGGGTITEGCYSIISKHSGKALDVSGWSTEDGGNIQQWAYSEDQANQKWNIVSAGDGYYKIESVHSGRALDVESASTEDGANIQQWGYGSGGDHKEFRFEEMDDGYYRIRTRHCDKCIDVYGASTDDGANVIQWSCHDNDNQRWELTYLSGLKSAKVSTGIDSKDMSNTLYIYPNPSSKGMIKIHLPSNIEGKVKISISNIQGKLYYSEVVSAKSVININHELPNGLYLINIKGNSLTATKKIIVK
jgi:hypothetical protein